MAQDYASWFYSGIKWQKTRTAYLQSQNYICERCGEPACLVHHKKHITPYNIHDPAVTLDFANLKAVCDKCHGLEHTDNTPRAGKPARLNGIAFDEEGNAVKQANVFLVCGCMGSGKTTYVTEHKGSKDLVVDLDYICAALMGEPHNMYLDHVPILSVALEVRALLYNIIAARRGNWERAFVVTSIANSGEMRAIAGDLNAEIVIMDISLKECIKRIEGDPRRAKTKHQFIQLAKKWHEDYANSIIIPPI